MNYKAKERSGSACQQSTIDGVVKRMEGAGTVLGSSGDHQGVLVSPKGPIQEILNSGLRFSDPPPAGTPEGMFHTSGIYCPLGYGSKVDGKPVCLDPFRTVACSPEHPIGQVVFIPAAVGVRYPRYPGEPKEDYTRREGHDGYFICGDIGQAIQGEHIDLFTAFINPYAADNPFLKFSSTREFGVCWISPDLDKDRERKYLFHMATDLNRRFPGLDDLTRAAYSNEYLYATAFSLGFWANYETTPRPTARAER